MGRADHGTKAGMGTCSGQSRVRGKGIKGYGNTQWQRRRGQCRARGQMRARTQDLDDVWAGHKS